MPPEDGKPSNSVLGHLWYSVSDGTDVLSRGFTGDRGKPFSDGKVTDSDNEDYQSVYSTVTIAIEAWQYNILVSSRIGNSGYPAI